MEKIEGEKYMCQRKLQDVLGKHAGRKQILEVKQA